MENLRDQISRVTDQFLGEVAGLALRHAEGLFSSAFATFGRKPRVADVSLTPRGRGAKRAPEELDQLAGKFVQFVRVNPGLRIEQINKQLGTTTVGLALPIRRLVAEGVVAVQGAKRSTTYRPGKNFSKWDGRVGRMGRAGEVGHASDASQAAEDGAGSSESSAPKPTTARSSRTRSASGRRSRSKRSSRRSKKSARGAKLGTQKKASAVAE